MPRSMASLGFRVVWLWSDWLFFSSASGRARGIFSDVRACVASTVVRGAARCGAVRSSTVRVLFLAFDARCIVVSMHTLFMSLRADRARCSREQKCLLAGPS